MASQSDTGLSVLAVLVRTNFALIQAQENSHHDLVVDADPTPLSDNGTAFSVVWHGDN
jgi:hypothetical protein